MSGDALPGVKAITAFIYGNIEDEGARARRERQVNRDLALGHIEARKIGNRWIGSKSQLAPGTIGVAPSVPERRPKQATD
jgi:hypothetical protein